MARNSKNPVDSVGLCGYGSGYPRSDSYRKHEEAHLAAFSQWKTLCHTSGYDFGRVLGYQPFSRTLRYAYLCSLLRNDTSNTAEPAKLVWCFWFPSDVHKRCAMRACRVPDNPVRLRPVLAARHLVGSMVVVESTARYWTKGILQRDHCFIPTTHFPFKLWWSFQHHLCVY